MKGRGKGKGRGAGAGGQDEEGKGKGKGKGKKGGRRRRRRTNPGMTPTALRSQDKPTLYLAHIQTAAIIALQAQVRLLSGILLVTIIARKDQAACAAVIEAQSDFTLALAEARSHLVHGQPNKGIGAPHITLSHSFCEALAQSDAQDAPIIEEWLSTIAGASEEESPFKIGLTFTHFSIHQIRSNSELVRFQVAISEGVVRNAVLSILKSLPDVTVSTGPAPPGFFEEELTDWMSVLTI